MIRKTAVAIVIAAFASTSAHAAIGGPPPPAASRPGPVYDSIPPNCLIDPFTGKLVCVIWPSCTLDPWTGKMNCPVGGLAPVRRN